LIKVENVKIITRRGGGGLHLNKCFILLQEIDNN
jgi:hypothetical protein